MLRGKSHSFFEGFGSLCDEKLEWHFFYICHYLHLHVFESNQTFVFHLLTKLFLQTTENCLHHHHAQRQNPQCISFEQIDLEEYLVATN